VHGILSASLNADYPASRGVGCQKPERQREVGYADYAAGRVEQNELAPIAFQISDCPSAA
jgi:hypothetical protein